MNSTVLSGRNYLVAEAASASRIDQFSAGLTGIRALAALMVLGHHIFAIGVPRILSFNIGDMQITYHWLLTCGWLGANVFFVLSGFLLAIPFVRHIEGVGKPVATGRYLLRRVKRVVPAYWIQITLLFAVLYWTATPPNWQAIALHLVFLQNLRQDYASVLNGVYWTLPTEFGYYLLLPLFAAIAGAFGMRKRTAWLIVCTALVIAAMAYRWLMYATVADAPVGTKFFVLLQLPGLIDHFAIGMLLAWVYVRNAAKASARTSDALVIVGLSGIVAMMALLDHVYLDYWNGHVLLFVGYTITAAFIGVLVLGTAMGGTVSRILFANSFMLFIGIVSYSLYLWHLPILHWTMALLARIGVAGDRLWWLAVIGIPASFLVATISYYLIERPFMTRRPQGTKTGIAST